MNEQEKLNEVYRQRNSLAIAFCRAAILLGWPAGKGIDGEGHPDERAGWSWVVYVDTPKGQISWHISPDSAHLLVDLPMYAGKWDGTYNGRDNNWPDALLPNTAEHINNKNKQYYIDKMNEESGR